MPQRRVATPTGPLTLTEEAGAITRIRWQDTQGATDRTPLLDRAAAQIAAFFAGELRRFDLPLQVRAAEFQQRICTRMSAIPFGETVTYGDLAREFSVTPQAVGQACGGNPLPVVIPCHRVLGTGNLGGFSGGAGIETKVWLLKQEGAAGLLI